MRHAVRIGDRGGDEVGVALGSRPPAWPREPASRAAWLALHVQLRGLPVRRGSLLATLPRALSSSCSRISSPISWQVLTVLLSSQPFWVTSARLSLQPSSKPCRPSSRCAASWPPPSWRHASSRPSCRRERAAICGPSSPCAFSKLSFQPSPPRIPFQLNDIGIIVRRSVTASLPRASQTPRKPAVFVPDYRIRCRARRGRSFPIPQPAVQGGADSRWRRRCAAFRRSSDRCRR